MKTNINIIKLKIDVEEMPLCPLCDQPIDTIDGATIGWVAKHGFTAACLVHTQCAVDED